MKHGFFFFASLVMLGSLFGCAAPASSGSLVEYRRTGGFIGFDDRLVVDANGKAVLTRKTGHFEFVLPQATVDQLTAAFTKAGFGKLGGEYLSARKGSDLFEYSVTYQGKTVRTMDTAVPDALQPVLQLLDQIIASGGKS